MKILLVQPYGHVAGHPPVYTRRICEALLNQRHTITLLTSRGVLGNWEKGLPIRHVNLNLNSSRLLDLMNSVPRVINWPYYMESLIAERAALLEGRKNGYDVIHFLDSEWFTLCMLYHQYQRPRNVVMTIVGYVYSTKSLRNRIRVKLSYIALRRLLTEAQAIVHSEHVRSWLFESRIASGDNRSIFVIPWGMEYKISLASQLTARRLLGIDYSGKILLFFGQMRRGKGLEILPEVVQGMKHRFRILMVGPDQEGFGVAFKRRLKELGCGKDLYFHPGYVADEEMELYFRASDAVLLLYDTKFLGASGVLAHACEFHVPVITSSAGNIEYFVQNHGVGFTCELQNIESVRKAINTFLDLSRTQILDIKNNIQHIVKKNSWDNVATRHVKVYKHVITNGK